MKHPIKPEDHHPSGVIQRGLNRLLAVVVTVRATGHRELPSDYAAGYANIQTPLHTSTDASWKYERESCGCVDSSNLQSQSGFGTTFRVITKSNKT